MIVGNDISRWQGDVNFDVYKNNSNFLIIKASEGSSYIDPKFSRNQAECRRVGLPLGYYHFARPDLLNSPESEAEWFLKVLGEIREGEVLCLDYEPTSNPQPVVDWCKRFMDRVLVRTGVRCFIYLNQSQVRKYDWKPVVDGNYALWLAAYIPTGDAFTGQWGSMAMQQWTSSQAVPGVVGRVDGNWFFGTLEQFRAYGYHKPVTPSSSVSPSRSPSASESPSLSPSSSKSPSKSPSASESPSVSPSVSTSPSPSPSSAPDECERCKSKMWEIEKVVMSDWWWIGRNYWGAKLEKIREILLS